VIPGLEDVTCYPKLLAGILDRGATEGQVAKLISQNILRAWSDVVAVRVQEEMKLENIKPMEDVWEGRKWRRFDGEYQMEDPDPEDKLGFGWFGVPPPADTV
jgi:membrane dipeptidase